MVNVKKNLQEFADKGQGPAARSLDRLPSFAQEAIVKLLGYPYQYPQLDSFTKCLMAVQHKQGIRGFLGKGDIEKARKQMDLQTQSIVNKPTHVQFVEDIRLPLQSGSVYARHYHPAPNKKLPLIVFYHGGGFVAGSVDSHDEMCRLLAVHSKSQVLSIDYPLAPEVGPHALIQSCEDALAWVYQNRRNFKILKNKIAIAGDSAGGNICAVLAQRTSRAVYAPQAQFLIYPAVDFKSRHPSFFAYKDGLVLTGSDIDIVTEKYPNAYHVDLDDTVISPTYGNLKKLAPAYIVTAGHDVLHDEGKIYAYKLRQNGVKVHYQDYEDQTHGFINLTPISKKAKKYVIEMSKDFRKFWDKYS
ncbi:alpha/beta hydrolase [Acinetobacter gerneri]|uniref:Alpha/beta hydrolase n=1 Tax=Acinetobacter gerneri TaxID=202952 RepID=A0AAW8JMS3_9GAMM|nr:alpha/beta hydrolase [Acinetobacter gerneri]MDQ9011894.1 alpha/beta hydrolase [Acinetobacter gerneri]MDQ9015999.1 alpha/beta hydrolase [Acinetobacter gerneri]MDQ9027150.1 alpha/beta hydrolase [Acinetobacter gerneri]MDQ9054433.1 alpha/beta hydrolase [Acinetobacter gerneri]MDQ9062101.1 alpha/beta hydrolase [Acinetobacter gerneri]